MRCLVFFITIIFSGEMVLFAEEKIEVFPSVPYDQFIIYQNLILFWIGIIGLIIIIKMKLKELKRIQDMGIDKEEKDIPFLD
ncbi:MAG: hypothetical protein N2596_06080 [Syntrophorhabdaceae bacterium]|nr:hypothetical protein [Syntrophorhabdaceae bacterium]